MTAAEKLSIKLPAAIKMSFEDYKRQTDFINNSSLKHMLQNPAEFQYNLKNPKEPTPSMILGTAIHTRVLEPDLFVTQYVTMPEFKGTGSVAARNEWKQANAGKIALDAEDMARVVGASRALKESKTASQLLSSGRAEESYFWQDESGTPCKCRPDFLRGGNIIVDLKSTQDASPREFQRDVANFKYHMQAAFYLDGVSAVTGQRFDKFVIVAVETKAPFGVAVYALDEATIETGRGLYRQALDQYVYCLNKNEWPSYPDIVQPLSLPSWAW